MTRELEGISGGMEGGGSVKMMGRGKGAVISSLTSKGDVCMGECV